MSFLPLQVAEVSADSLASAEATLADKISDLSQLPTDELIKTGLGWVAEVSVKILVAIVIYLVGRWLIRYAVRFIETIMNARKVDLTLKSFAVRLTRVVLLILLVVTIIGVLGLDTTSFVALFASAGLAFGMAMSGTLQNFAGGVMILVLKPFKVGDVIEAQGYTGIVKEIMLFNTLVNTFDNKAVLIPNGGVSTGIINNYSHEQNRRVDWSIGISYGDDYDKAKAVMLSILNSDERVLKDPEVFIALEALADSSVNIVVRAWVKSADYWGVFFDFNEQVYKQLPANGLSFPFPQMDVHLTK